MMTRLLSVLVLAAGVVFGQQALPPLPALPAELGPVFSAPGGDALAAMFKPMDGSLPVTWVEQPGQGGYLRLPANFANTTHTRASWDIPVQLDMAAARGLQFDFFCADITPFDYMRVYFHSGDGWYANSFGINNGDQWNRVKIDKAESSTEGHPAGWGVIDTVRISIWRGENRDSVAAIANVGVVGSKPEVLVVRAESNIRANDAEAKGYSSYAANVSNTVDVLDIPYALVSDLDLTAAMLDGPGTVVLPYNPRLPDAVLGLLQGFVAKGGKVVACYNLAGGVAELIGVSNARWQRSSGGNYLGFQATAGRLAGQPDFAPQSSPHSTLVDVGADGRVIATWRKQDGEDSGLPAVVVTPRGAFIGHVWNNENDSRKRQFLLAVLGNLAPKLWERAAQAEFNRIGAIGPHRDFAEFEKAFPAQAATAAQADLTAARELRQRAEAALLAKQWQECIVLSSDAADRVLKAWCRTQPSQADDFRGFWCHDATGLPGKSWDESIKLLSESGFNAIVPNMLWGATCSYPSKVLTPEARVAERGDQVAQCLAACAKYGVKCHVWKVNWNCGSQASKDLLADLAAQKRTQKSFDGTENTRWLCPSHPVNQQLEVDAMLELVRNYPTLDGIHFDYIRYPGPEGCFCDGCRERFQQRLGAVVENWPRDVREKDDLREPWLQFRRDAITTVVRQVHEQAKKIRPGIEISAAVFRNWPQCRDSVAQDWSLWCERGWLDFVCPMNYTDSNLEFEQQCRRQLAPSHGVPLYPGIGMSCWRNPNDAVKLTEQIAAVRRVGMRGFTVFNYDSHAEANLPLVKLGVTSWPVPVARP